MIVTEDTAGSYSACTSGFGVKRTDGSRFVTTADHCGGHSWWNSPVYPFPIRTNSRYVGPTAQTFFGTYANTYLDSQIIWAPSGSSDIIWAGGQPPYRVYISGYVGVSQGDPTCIEGSWPPSESCGAVFAADYGDGYSQYLVGITNGNYTKDGDSGAPSWMNSYFGPLAQGIHNGSFVGAPNLAAEMKINIVLFVHNASLTTVASP